MTAIQEKQSTAIQQGQYDLIKGDYTPEEAFEIIVHLLMKKMNFHEMKSFSQQIRFGLEDEASLKRIEELKISKEAIKQLVKEAKLSGKRMRVKSNITVELI
jgi:hypothetical protein